MVLISVNEQNYFQHNENFYKPSKGVAMGSPLSGTLAELYLQNIEHRYIFSDCVIWTIEKGVVRFQLKATGPNNLP